MSDMPEFTAQDWRLISDAITSHRAWLKRTLPGPQYLTDLKARIDELGVLQAKVITACRAASTRRDEP